MSDQRPVMSASRAVLLFGTSPGLHRVVHQAGSQVGTLFSPEERQAILDRVLDTLRTDDRVAGVVIVGSGAVGFDDDYSDIDLAVVVAEEEDTLPVFRDWKPRIEALLPVIHSFETIYGPHSYLYGFLFKGFLELNLGFVCLANLFAKRARWQVAFDRSGKIENIMRSSWEQRVEPDVQTAYLRRLDSIWHYIIQVITALKRGHPWRALHELEQIRNRAVELAGLRLRLETKHFRHVDQMPEELLVELERTLICSLEPVDILRALKATTACFFREARALDNALGLDVASDLEARMQDYIALSSANNE
jgi:predicted nucleotidyltransferase